MPKRQTQFEQDFNLDLSQSKLNNDDNKKFGQESLELTYKGRGCTKNNTHTNLLTFTASVRHCWTEIDGPIGFIRGIIIP